MGIDRRKFIGAAAAATIVPFIPFRDRIDLTKKVQATPLPKTTKKAQATRLPKTTLVNIPTDSISQLLWEAGCGKESSVESLVKTIHDVVNAKFNDNKIFDIFNLSYLHDDHRLILRDHNLFKPQYYEMSSSVDILQKYLREARVDVIMRMVDVLANSIIKKVKDDSWQTIIYAGTDRSVVFYDEHATGKFSKRLVSEMKMGMRRGCGNPTSMYRGRLTDLYISPEAREDTKNWQMIGGDTGLVTQIFNVNLHSLEELGAGQEYQNFYENELKGTLPKGSNQICVGLDLSKGHASPFQISRPLHKSKWEIFHNSELLRERKLGFDLKGQISIACINNQAVLLGRHS